MVIQYRKENIQNSVHLRYNFIIYWVFFNHLWILGVFSHFFHLFLSDFVQFLLLISSPLSFDPNSLGVFTQFFGVILLSSKLTEVIRKNGHTKKLTQVEEKAIAHTYTQTPKEDEVVL